MFAVSYLFVYSFNIMCMRHRIVPVRAPPDPVIVLYSGSDDNIEQVTYILCLNGWVPEMYELWSPSLKEFARFIRSLEFDSSTILEKTLSRLYSQISGDAVFLSLVGDR